MTFEPNKSIFFLVMSQKYFTIFLQKGDIQTNNDIFTKGCQTFKYS